MIRVNLLRSLAGWLVLTAASPLLAQNDGNSLRQQLDREFSRGPEVGQPLPDVTLFDNQGKPIRLQSLKGSHTVLVFGCLT